MAKAVVLRSVGWASFTALALVVACERSTVVPVAVATIQLTPPEATMLAGASMAFEAVPRGADGDELSGRFTTWTSESPAVATVSAIGEVQALQPGTTRVTATIEGVSASSDLTVLPGPEIQLEPSTLGFSGFTDDGALTPQNINVTNGTENGQVSGLEMFISYDASGPAGWLAASTLSGSTAPATIVVRPNVFGLEEGDYAASIEVRSNTAVNTPQVASVTLTVGDALPAIALSQSTAAVSLPFLFPNPAPFANIGVSNAGGGQLTGLSVVIRGAISGWLTATLDGTQAPTTLRLVARAGVLPPGQYVATVDVRSSAASNSPRSVVATLTITP
ncbi:MAG: Ig-like domain-containing protein [Longimicrobiales bacterium]